MGKLIKLEYARCKINEYIKYCIICDIIILGVMISIAYLLMDFKDNSILNKMSAFYMINSLIMLVTMCLACKLIISGFIEDLNKRNNKVLFLHIVDKKKHIISRMIILALFTFIAIVISNIIVQSGFYYISRLLNVINYEYDLLTIMNYLTIVIKFAGVCTLSNFICLYLGIETNSKSIIIMLELFLLLLICAFYNNIIPLEKNYLYIPICTIGMFCIFLCLNKFNKRDIRNK